MRIIIPESLTTVAGRLKRGYGSFCFMSVLNSENLSKLQNLSNLKEPGKQLGKLRIWTLWSWVRPEIETLHFLQALGILVVHEFHLEFW